MKWALEEKWNASFRPSVHWGAEFLANRVRIIGLTEKSGQVTVFAFFDGSYAEAEGFANTHGLAFQGLHTAVSHLPFKFEILDSGVSQEEVSANAERLKPVGLPLEAWEYQEIFFAGEKYLALLREDVLKSFTERLPSSLASLWNLSLSPLALLPLATPSDIPNRVAALIVESEETHVLFLRGGIPEAYAKVFTGYEEARRNPALFLREMKKALVYHYGGKFPGDALESFCLWNKDSGGELSTLLSTLGLTESILSWPFPAKLWPSQFQVAGALAWQAMRPADPLLSLSIPIPREAQNHRQWLGRTGTLARFGFRAMAVLALLALVLSLAVATFGWRVKSKAQAWSGQLQKWDEFQKLRSSTELELLGLQGLLERRTESNTALRKIAGLLPPEVWLEEWTLESSSKGRFIHQITGYSFSEGRVPEFLSKLEFGKQFASVKLKSTERIQGEYVEKKTGIKANHKDLIRFQMVVTE